MKYISPFFKSAGLMYSLQIVESTVYQIKNSVKMAAVCSLMDCRTSFADKGVKMFQLTETRKSLWNNALKDHSMDNKKIKVICNKHFEKKNIGKARGLKKGAVPTLFHYNGLKVNHVKSLLRDHSYCVNMETYNNMKNSLKKNKVK